MATKEEHITQLKSDNAELYSGQLMQQHKMLKIL